MNMEKESFYNGNLEEHREVLLFYFLPVIQHELNGLGIMWNRRHVRSVQLDQQENLIFCFIFQLMLIMKIKVYQLTKMTYKLLLKSLAYPFTSS